MSLCRSCGNPIIWTVTANGKKMPVDRDPVGGTFVLVYDELDPSTAPRSLSEDVHLSHFATCPNADQHRRSR